MYTRIGVREGRRGGKASLRVYKVLSVVHCHTGDPTLYGKEKVRGDTRNLHKDQRSSYDISPSEGSIENGVRDYLRQSKID